MKDLYDNYISLGYFCEVAQDLEKLGLRNMSSPFDWGISSFPGVVEAIENNFEGFMDYENLSQVSSNRRHYHEDKYNFFFFHDFNKYKSLDEQYEQVKEKYNRRIDRFLKSIQRPTLFVKYISTEKLDSSGKSKELIWIEDNYQYILDVIRKKNPENDIVFIGDKSVISDVIKVYNVPKDEGDKVSRLPIYNNEELFPLLSVVEFPGKAENVERYKGKMKKRNSFLQRSKKKVNSILQSIFLKEYEHTKIYEEVE